MIIGSLALTLRNSAAPGLGVESLSIHFRFCTIGCVNAPLNVVAEHVATKDLSFLDPWRFGRSYIKSFMRDTRHGSSMLTGEGHGIRAETSGGFQRSANVPAIP